MAKARSVDKHEMPSLALVFGYIAIKDLQRLEDRIAVLDRLGYGSLEIAKICGKTRAVISIKKSRMKKHGTLRRT